tara:strand:+ start:456 stop:755 length:300 start_codon:yes stop_codon:yes gene_type:complete
MHSLLAIILPTLPALLTSTTDIQQRLDAPAITDFPVLDIGADFDDDAGALVPGAFGAECRHWRDVPVVQHEVDVRHAETGCVQLEEDLVGTWLGLSALL